MEVFYKPNSLICLNKKQLTMLQIASMSILLKKAQDKIHFNELLKNGDIKSKTDTVLNELDLFKFVYKIKTEELLEYLPQNLRLQDTNMIIENIKKISQAQVESRDKYRYSFLNIFQGVVYDSGRQEISFQISNILTQMFMTNSGCIDGDKLIYGNCTAVPHCKKNENNKMGNTTYYFYEWVLQYLKLSQANQFTFEKPFYKSINIEDFKDILGINYPRLQDFKKKILPKLKKDLFDIGINVDFKILGRGANARELDIYIFKPSIVPEFLYSQNELEKINKSKSKESPDVIYISKEKSPEILLRLGVPKEDIQGILETKLYMKYYSHLVDHKLNRDYMVPIEEFDKGNRIKYYLSKDKIYKEQYSKLCELIKREDATIKIMNTKNYKKYVVVMNRLKINPASEDNFKLGYRIG